MVNSGEKRVVKRTPQAIIALLFSFIWATGRGMVVRLILSFVFVVVTICLNVSIPLIFKKVVNSLSSCNAMNITTLQLLFVLYGVTWILSKVTVQMREIVIARLLERAIRLLSVRLFDHLHALSLRFHLERKTGGITTIISRIQRAFPDIIMELFIYLIPPIVEVIIAMGILWHMYSLTYGLLLFLILGIYMIFSMIAIGWLAKAQRVNNQKEERVSTRLVDSLINYETVKYFNNQEFEHDQYDAALGELEDAATRKQVRSELVHLGQGVIIGLGLLVLTWISGNAVIQGTMQVGDFVLINGYLLQFFYPLSFFGILLRHIRRGFTDMENAFALLDLEPEIVDAPNAIALAPSAVRITFEDVSFGYQVARPILKGVSFTVPEGKTVAIVGPTGSGKSTIARLLFRSYDVSAGRILVNGNDIRSITQDSLRALFGIVPQDTVLFNNTLYYNVAYGNPSAPVEQVERAMQLAHLDNLVAALPYGVATMVGERGLKLSGGEKQRVAIARALVKNPKMYIFDEATSALDTRTERDIQKNIEEISQGSTALIIAHRLSTVINADQIIVLEHGLVAETGTHAELLAKGGLYKRLWDQQQHDGPSR